MVKLSVLLVGAWAWRCLRSNLGVGESVPLRPPFGGFRIIELRIVVVGPAFPECELIFVGTRTRNGSFTSDLIVFSIRQFRLKLEFLGLRANRMKWFICSRSRILCIGSDSFRVYDDFAEGFSACTETVGFITFTVDGKGRGGVVWFEYCWWVVFIWRRVDIYKQNVIWVKTQ